jgi:23S rRNA pseudouridine955/2504/2580 synthase
LRTLRPTEDLELVHRLDRDTSGCLLVAKRRSALRMLHELIREGAFEKRYLALQKGSWQFGEKRVDVPLQVDHRSGGERTVRAVKGGGKPSLSIFKPVQFFGRVATLMEVSIHTGRTHQIRVHAAHLGHPVAGDEKYGDADFNAGMHAKGLGRMFLHAHSLSFEWPHGAVFSASAPLPPELGSVLDRLIDRSASGHRKPRAAQRPGKPKQRQANEGTRIARVDRLKQRDA